MTNISTYQFAELSGLKELREELKEKCREWGLKGTIQLSTEGINLFVAGGAEAVDRLLVRLRQVPGLETLMPKVSLSDGQPFKRMLVRLKREIIAFGVEGVNPARHTSPKLAPGELKRWLDEGRPVTLLDTRNDYEVGLGTFKGAMDPKIKTFRAFPEAVRKLPESLKETPVVVFCTGGIRCEKAGPFMEMEGFKSVYQLDGGILRYFEECGGDHYEGDCFVFDQRVGVDPALRETSHLLCYACQAPLEAEDCEDPRFVAGESCPRCFKPDPGGMAERIAAREESLRNHCDPLPGSVPLENRRPVPIPARFDKQCLGDALAGLFPQETADEWARRIADGRFVNDAGEVREADHVVRAGERVLQVYPPAVEPAVAAGIRIAHEDEALILVEKPAPLPMHAGGRFHRNTLLHLLGLVYEPEMPRVVHRLDANTSGLVVLARTRRICKRMQRQLREGRFEKRYLARVAGHPENDRFFSEAPVSSGPVATGARVVDAGNGLASRTDFEVIERCGDGSALLLATLGSGRTNQIRVHLAALGFPVAGDPTYRADGAIGEAQTLPVDAPPMQLHAWKLAFDHPLTGERMAFEAERPGWAQRSASSSS